MALLGITDQGAASAESSMHDSVALKVSDVVVQRIEAVKIPQRNRVFLDTLP